MRKKGPLISYTIIPVILITGFLFYQYFIKIYESTLETNPQNLFADNQSTLKISVIPLNSFGWKALFRNASSEFEIIEGESLVEIKSLVEEKGELVLKAKHKEGKVVVKIKSKYSLLPMIVEIQIMPNLT